MPDAAFPPGFFDRADPSPDTEFYGPPRLRTPRTGGDPLFAVWAARR